MYQQTDDIPLDADFLRQLADELSMKYWQKRCDVPVVWNGRLSRSIGRFVYCTKGNRREPLKIEMSKQAVPHLNLKQFEAMLLHELCHYFLYIAGLPFHDRDERFLHELGRVGGLPTRTVQIPRKHFELYCAGCRKKLGVRKRLNTSKFVSRCCSKPILKKEVWI